MNDIRVLICEDDNEISDALSTGLVQEGFQVSLANNGKEAVEKALGEHPNVILMDMMMPEMNGHEAVAKIRRDTWGRTAKVIFLTSSSDPESVVKAVESGSEEYLIKPHVTLKDIAKKIRVVNYT